MKRQPHFQIVHGENGWWVRLVSANSQIVWVTETYNRRRGALRAIAMMEKALGHTQGLERRDVEA